MHNGDETGGRMSIKRRIDIKLADWFRDNAQAPMRIVLSPKAIDCFVVELKEHVFVCPNCKLASLTYAGYPVETMTDKDVMIE